MPEESQASEVGEGTLGTVRRVIRRVVDPFRYDDDLDVFSIPDTQTTSVRGDVGWQRRPPAVVECPRCETGFEHRHARDRIDCPRCVAEFPAESFAELKLLELSCPRCGSTLDHGIRHPKVFDVPQWAHCEECQYHWEFTHSF